jgi:uncharacterized protein (DUF1800 family)
MDVQALNSRAALALIRFGLGRRGGEPAPLDPLGWLDAQLDGPDPALDSPSATCTEVLLAWQQDRKNPPPEGQKRRTQVMWEADFATALNGMVDTIAPFRERLAWFWANHFTISVKKGDVRPLAMPFVREAIRPHVAGRFQDMLFAVMRHPAMLWYLDNQESVGPNSLVGQKSHHGLNENLARECLELHTLGADAGYTQQDVTEFAKLLTGWWFGPNAPLPVFTFDPHRHEPGDKTLMGLTFPPGEEGGIAALTWLANHPATFHHLATKLVRHFVADDPAPEDVARIAGVLRETRGDLGRATRAVLRLPSAWRGLTKLRAPWEYVVALVRGLDLAAGNRPNLLNMMGNLGQPFMAAPLPNGWSDNGAVWADGELLLRRADAALAVAPRARGADPVEVARATLGELLSEPTRSAVQHAASRDEGLALLLASPEFFRR